MLPDYKHTVVCLFPNSDLAENFEKNNVELICLHHKGWKTLFSSARKLRAVIKNTKPLLVHAHLFEATVCARLATPASVPLVSTLHSLYSIDAFQKNKKSIWAERVTLRKRHTLIGVSKYVLDDYLKFIRFTGKRFVLYNFLPNDFFERRSTAVSSNSFKCVAVGNLKEAKNYHYLLEIFSRLSDKNITLDIYGAGTLRKELQEKIDKEKLPVTLKGRAQDTKQLFRDYDLFIQASSHEGFGLSVIEAMASQIPVFISDIPVFREITNGLAHFFPLNNSGKAAEGLSSLKNNSEKRNQYIEKAYDYCSRLYNEQTYKKKLLEIYNHVLS